MIVHLSTEVDLTELENKVREALGAQRFDVSVLRSKPYIDMRRTLLCLLGGGHVSNAWQKEARWPLHGPVPDVHPHTHAYTQSYNVARNHAPGP